MSKCHIETCQQKTFGCMLNGRYYCIEHTRELMKTIPKH